MELIKKNIHMNKIIKSEVAQIHVNYEGCVTDGKPGMTSIINHCEQATVENVTVRNNQVIIGGTIAYNIMYYSGEKGRIDCIEGEIPFEEAIKIMELDEDCMVNVKVLMTSSAVKKVDARNYIYKIQMVAYVTVEKIEDLETATSINDETVMCKYETIDGLSIVADKNETLRINDQIAVPMGKPPIGEIIWKDIRIKNINTKLMDGMLHVGGELYIFIMYLPEGGEGPYQWIETSLNFGQNIEMSEAMENMVSYVNVDINNINIEPEMNEDNEVRLVNVNVLLKLNIKLYEEKQIEILEDLYAPGRNLVPVMEECSYEKLLVKNASRTKNTVKLSIDQSKGSILQICNSGAEVKIERIEVSDNGLKATGKIKAYIMYISTDDTQPVCYEWKEVDFEHRIDADGIMTEDKYYVSWRVEQVNTNMISTENVEVKAVIALEAIVFKEIKKKFIMQVNEEPVDMEAINNAPLIKGYVVQSGDTLWKLAKENHTTMENIIETNQLQNQHIKKGDRLLLIKSCQ